jgi:ABC-type nitrate/sulfonate/bicarbonate transport system ATPase subunit
LTSVQTSEDVPGAEGAGTTPLIEIRGVSKTYETKRGPVAAPRDVSLAVGRREFVSLVGPRGRGESTMLHIVAGLIPQTFNQKSRS